MDRISAMTVFVRIAEGGGFAQAARALHMSPPSVTRAIAQLEEHLGARLLTRTTRSVQLTEAGRQYLTDCRRILADLSEAESTAAGAHGTPVGRLTVTAPVMFGRMHVLPVLLDYLDSYPAVSGQLLLLDRVVNMMEEGVDVSIRIGALPDSGLSAVKVGSVDHVICAAPAYLAKAPALTAPSDLADHRIISAGASWNPTEWLFAGGYKGAISVSPNLVCNANAAAIDAAKSGHGIVRVLSYQVSDAIASGDLVPVLSAFQPPSHPIHIVHPDGRRASARVRGFVDLCRDRLREKFAE